MIWVRVYDMPFHVCLIILNSPFLCVFGDDHVTCYTWTNDVSGGASDV